MKQIIIRGAIVMAMSGTFAVPAYAEDTGLIRHLNAQTRAQVQAHKSETAEPEGYTNHAGPVTSERINNAQKQAGAGIRG